jgi:hypothetical protein
MGKLSIQVSIGIALDGSLRKCRTQRKKKRNAVSLVRVYFCFGFLLGRASNTEMIVIYKKQSSKTNKIII